MKHIESRLQTACVKWFRLAHPEFAYVLFSVPNGGARTAAEGKILKGEGVVAGVSDLILLTPRNGYGCLCIEMKTKAGLQRESQKIWQQETEKHGNKYVVVRSFDDFVKEIDDYLGKPNSNEAREQLKKLLNK